MPVFPAPLARLAVALLLAATASAQGLPEVLYYKFNESSGTTTANLAIPGAGAANGTLTGLTLGPGGQFGNALQGLSSTTGANSVSTGWVPAFGSASWTISFWIDVAGQVGTTTATLMYAFGETGSTLRCSINSTSGAGNLALRGNFSTVTTTGGPLSAGPRVVHWVHDSAAGQVRCYIDGVLNISSNQTLTINGTNPFLVGSYPAGSSPRSILTGVRMDEFRVYNRALSAAEIAATWNTSLQGAPLIAAFQKTVSTGGAPNLVLFTDQSTSTAPGGITLRQWDFEDDGIIDSTATNPAHIYPQNGTYTVRLTVQDGVNAPVSTAEMVSFSGLGLVALTGGNGTGDLNLWPAPPPAGMSEGYTFISLSPANPTGSGIFLGLNIDDTLISILSFPAVAGDIFHFLPAPGLYPSVPLVFSPGTLSSLAGVSLDVVVVYLVPPAVVATPARRLDF
jgi:PKD repeat protein